MNLGLKWDDGGLKIRVVIVKWVVSWGIEGLGKLFGGRRCIEKWGEMGYYVLKKEDEVEWVIRRVRK